MVYVIVKLLQYDPISIAVSQNRGSYQAKASVSVGGSAEEEVAFIQEAAET